MNAIEMLEPEHDELIASHRRAVAELLQLDPDDEELAEELAAAEEWGEHYPREDEEVELVPQVKQLLWVDERDALGGEIAHRFFEM